MTTKEKLKQYIDYKRISMSEFGRKINVSDGFLRTKGSVMTDKLIPVRNIFRDLNMNWLLFDEGNMILNEESVVNEPDAQYGKCDPNMLMEVLNENRQLNKEIRALQETVEDLKKDSDRIRN